MIKHYTNIWITLLNFTYLPLWYWLLRSGMKDVMSLPSGVSF